MCRCSANLLHCRSPLSFIFCASSASITWERTASRRTPAFSSHLITAAILRRPCNSLLNPFTRQQFHVNVSSCSTRGSPCLSTLLWGCSSFDLRVRATLARRSRYNGGVRICPERIGQGDSFAGSLCFGCSAVC